MRPRVGEGDCKRASKPSASSGHEGDLPTQIDQRGVASVLNARASSSDRPRQQRGRAQAVEEGEEAEDHLPRRRLIRQWRIMAPHGPQQQPAELALSGIGFISSA